MKKWNLKSLLAMLLTLCLLLGSVAALAEEGVAPTDGAEAVALPDPVVAEDPVVAADPVAPAPTTPTVTVAGGETAGVVNVTLTDDSTVKADTALDVRADYDYEYDDMDNKVVTFNGDKVVVNDDPKLIGDAGNKLIEGANDLTVTAGDLAVNFTEPLKEEDPQYDEDGNPLLDANGQPIVDVSLDSSVTALDISTDDEAKNEKITVTTGDLYAASNSAGKTQEATAEAFNIFNDGEKNTVTLTVDGDTFASATVTDVTDKKESYPEATAWGPYVTTEDGSVSDAEVHGDSKSVATATGAKYAYASAHGANSYSEDENSKSELDVHNVTSVATAVGKDAEAYASGVCASAQQSTATLTADDVTATAISGEQAWAYGAEAYAEEGGTATVKVQDVTATATLKDADTTPPTSDSADRNEASATGLYADAHNGTAVMEVVGEVNAKSSEDATAIYARAYGSDKVWSSKEKKYVDNTMPGKATVTVTGDVVADGEESVMGIQVEAYTDSEYDSKTKESTYDKQGGTVDITVKGDVFALGEETHQSEDQINGAFLYAAPNATANLTVTGDVIAIGKDSVGLFTEAMKGGQINALVDGTVYGSGVAIAVDKSFQQKIYDTKGEQTNKDAKPTEYDITAPNIMVWKASENDNGRIVEVYDQVWTSTAKEVKKTREDGTEYTATEYDYDRTRTVDVAASEALEKQIWYIVKVSEKWQDKVTAVGTNTYTVNGTTYDLAHQDEDVTLTINLSSKKKLKAIMYNDGTKAEYVKNADGTYTIKMLRGGAMDLRLKVKNKYSDKAAATTTEAKDEDPTVNGVKATDRIEFVKCMKKVGETIDANGGKVDVAGAKALLSADELEAWEKLGAQDKLLATAAAMGFADAVKAEGGLSEDGAALVDQIKARLDDMNETERADYDAQVDKAFPKGTATVDEETKDSFDFAMTVGSEKDTYTFFDDNGTWKLCGIKQA